MKLNLGSGNKQYEGYLNIDSDINSYADYILNLETDNLPFEDDSVDHVIAHHILEHLGDGFFHCLQELYRVCKNYTVIDIRVPHPRHDIFLIDATHKRPIYPHTLDMFSRERNDKDIENGGSETPLSYIYNVNFKVVDHIFILDPYWKPRFEQLSNEECEHIARSFNNVISEIFIKLVVIKDEKSNGNS